MPPIGLDDLPEEILHEIAAYLLHPDQYPTSTQPKPFEHTCIIRRNSPQGKDLTSLSSCCRWMRHALFGRWVMGMMGSLSVEICEHDLEMVESLAKETRDCVKYETVSPIRNHVADY
jgi:hypothetical protein